MIYAILKADSNYLLKKNKYYENTPETYPSPDTNTTDNRNQEQVDSRVKTKIYNQSPSPAVALHHHNFYAPQAILFRSEFFRTVGIHAVCVVWLLPANFHEPRANLFWS